MAPLFTSPPTCICWSPTGSIINLSIFTKGNCRYATSHLPLWVTNEGREVNSRDIMYSHQMVWELRRMPDFFKMTPDDVIATFLQYEEHLRESKRLIATYGGPSSNL